MKKMRKFKFTLIEVTVAFGVLAILIMFLMQFLTTAQTSWNFAEKRARAYADSRTAFDFIEKALNSADRSAAVSTGTSLSFKGVKPYGDREYKTMTVNLNNGILAFDGDELISNVVSFASQNISGKSYAVRLVMFGSETDYTEYTAETDADKKSAYLSKHGFSFVRLINLQ